MNQDRNDRTPNADSDPLVSAEYRAAATERTPSELDALVLRKAAATARESAGLRAFTAFWFRPLAFVATLALSLALVLELTSEQYGIEPAASPDTRDFREEDNSPPGKIQSAPVPAPAKASAPLVESVPAQADETASADFAKMIEAGSRRMQEAKDATDAAIQSRQQAKSAREAQVDEPGAVSAYAVVSDVVPTHCAQQQKRNALTWWQCIGELEEAGRYDEAKAELDLFNAAHPNFEAPEILPSQ